MSSEIRLSTLSTYVIPEGFCGGTSFQDEIMSDEAILKSIELAKSDFLRGQVALGIILPEPLIKQEQINAAILYQGVSPLIQNLIATYTGKGTALDVGAGTGQDSIALLLRGWNVYVLDVHKEVLNVFKKTVPDTLGKYTIMHKDITKISLTAGLLDLVIADDVLWCLPPDTLIPTIKKIYAALLPGGIFMGTLLVNRELTTEDDIVVMASIRALNSYSYTHPATAPNILRYAGFHVEACSVNPLPGHPSHPGKVVAFVARKV